MDIDPGWLTSAGYMYNQGRNEWERADYLESPQKPLAEYEVPYYSGGAGAGVGAPAGTPGTISFGGAGSRYGIGLVHWRI